MNRNAALRSLALADRNLCGVAVTVLVIELRPRLVERSLCLLLRLLQGSLWLLLAVQDPVDRVLPGCLELLTGGVRGHRKGVVVRLVHRRDRGVPLLVTRGLD